MADYRIDVFITASEGRKGWVEADSIEDAREKFEQQLDDHDIWEVTQDMGVYGDTEWEFTEISSEDGPNGVPQVWRPEPKLHGFFLAELSTRNFDFTALGRTEDEARAAMQEGWRKHGEQYGAEGMFTWEELAEDVNFRRIAPGQCLRDGEPLSRL